MADSGKIPPGARFLTPRLAQTFKWYTGHRDVADWKDVPQDAAAIVEWWRSHPGHLRHRPTDRPIRAGTNRWPNSARSGSSNWAQEYDADYVITERTDPPLELDAVYDNRTYVIYRLR